MELSLLPYQVYQQKMVRMGVIEDLKRPNMDHSTDFDGASPEILLNCAILGNTISPSWFEQWYNMDMLQVIIDPRHIIQHGKALCDYDDPTLRNPVILPLPFFDMCYHLPKKTQIFLGMLSFEMQMDNHTSYPPYIIVGQTAMKMLQALYTDVGSNRHDKNPDDYMDFMNQINHSLDYSDEILPLFHMLNQMQIAYTQLSDDQKGDIDVWHLGTKSGKLVCFPIEYAYGLWINPDAPTVTSHETPLFL